MRINDDLSQPVIVHAAKLDWLPSPATDLPSVNLDTGLAIWENSTRYLLSLQCGPFSDSLREHAVDHRLDGSHLLAILTEIILSGIAPPIPTALGIG